jgi:hypothetical protein
MPAGLAKSLIRETVQPPFKNLADVVVLIHGP